MEHTAEEARQYFNDRPEALQECLDTYEESEELPDYMKNEKTKNMWLAGCWQNTILIDAGATEQELKDFGFALGQKCLFGEPYSLAAATVNNFLQGIQEEPGEELAKKLNKEHLGI